MTRTWATLELENSCKMNTCKNRLRYSGERVLQSLVQRPYLLPFPWKDSLATAQETPFEMSLKRLAERAFRAVTKCRVKKATARVQGVVEEVDRRYVFALGAVDIKIDIGDDLLVKIDIEAFRQASIWRSWAHFAVAKACAKANGRNMLPRG